MASGESKLKLIHLFYIILTVVAGAALSLGALANQQKVNSTEIDKKVDKDIFIQHSENQIRQFDKFDKKQDKILDILIEIQKK